MLSGKLFHGDAPRVKEFSGTHNERNGNAIKETEVIAQEKLNQFRENTDEEIDSLNLQQQIDFFADIIVENLITHFYEH